MQFFTVLLFQLTGCPCVRPFESVKSMPKSILKCKWKGLLSLSPLKMKTFELDLWIHSIHSSS